MSTTGAYASKVKVWDLALRLFHWLLAAGFFFAYFTVASPAQLILHVWAGYGVLGLLCFRLVWGVIGPRFTRFSDMLYGPIALLRYLWRALTFRTKHYLGYSPVGGLIAIVFIVCLLLTAWSGMLLYGATSQRGPMAWLMQTANPDSIAGLASLHGFAAWLSVMLVVTHLAVAFWESLLRRSNLFFAMISGYQSVYNSASSATPDPNLDSSTVQIPGYDVWVDPAAIVKVDLGRTDDGQPQVKLMINNESQPRVFLFSERRQALKFYQTIWALKHNYYDTARADSQPIA